MTRRSSTKPTALLCLGVAVLGVAACKREAEGPRMVIHNVTLIDGTDRGPRPGMSVAIEADRIVAVGPAERVAAGGGDITVDGTGKYLIPGLWDMHVHFVAYAEHSFPLFLANGVTTVRDMGGDLRLSGWLRQEVQQGRLMGPEVLVAGPVLDAPFVVDAVRGTPWQLGRAAVPDATTAAQLVDSLSDIGVDHLKVHSMTPRAAYFSILRQARKHRLSVVGHVPDSVHPREAIEAGQRTIEHHFRIALASSARGADLSAAMLTRMQLYRDTAGPRARVLPLFVLRLAADDSARRAYDAATAEAFADLARRKSVWFDPTLIVLKTMLRNNEPEMRDFPELKYAPRAAREYEDGIPSLADPLPADIEEGRRLWRDVLESFGPLVQGGAKFIAGTDVPVLPLVPGFSLQRELGLLVEMGLTPLEALQAASRNAAEAAGLLRRVGTIEKGKRADLVLLAADPLADIGNTSQIEAVVTRGRLLDRRAIDRMLGDAEAYARER